MTEPDFLTLLAQLGEKYGNFLEEVEGLRAEAKAFKSSARRYELLETSLRICGAPADAVQIFFDDEICRRELSEMILRFYRSRNEQMRAHEEGRTRRADGHLRSKVEQAQARAALLSELSELKAARRAKRSRRSAERALRSLVRNDRYRVSVDYRDLPADLLLCCSTPFPDENVLRRIPVYEWQNWRCEEGKEPAEIEFALLVFRDDEEETGVVNSRAYRIGLRLATVKESQAFLLANPDDVANQMGIISNGPYVTQTLQIQTRGSFILRSHLLLNPSEEFPSAYADHMSAKRGYLYVENEPP